MLTVLACLASLVLIPWAAIKGRAYRGLYLAGAVLLFLLGFFVLSMPAGVDNPATATAAEIRGAQVIDAVAPSLGGWLVVTAVACVVGALAFRAKSRSAPAKV